MLAHKRQHINQITKLLELGQICPITTSLNKSK